MMTLTVFPHRRTSVMSGFLLAIGGIVLLACVGWLQGELDRRQDGTTAQIEELAELPRGAVLRPAFLGYHHLGADVLWLRLLQVIGKKRNSAEEYEWIYHALDVITTLDPQYDYAYYVGGVVLANLAGRVDLSNRLLDKGFKENPTVWNIPFLLGYNHYFILADAAKAADYIAAAARLFDSPSYLPGIATRMYAEANNPDTALQFLEALWRQIQDAEMRGVLEKRAKEVTIERDLRVLESAIQTYRSQWGYVPHNLRDLVTSNILARIPQEPFNGEYRLDPTTGTVTSSTHPERLKTFHKRQQPSYVFPKAWE